MYRHNFTVRWDNFTGIQTVIFSINYTEWHLPLKSTKLVIFSPSENNLNFTKKCQEFNELDCAFSLHKTDFARSMSFRFNSCSFFELLKSEKVCKLTVNVFFLFPWLLSSVRLLIIKRGETFAYFCLFCRRETLRKRRKLCAISFTCLKDTNCVNNLT